MKNITSTFLLTPIAISIVSCLLIILLNITPYSQMVWILWGIALFSTLYVSLIISGLCSFWFAEWISVQTAKLLYVNKQSINH